MTLGVRVCLLILAVAAAPVGASAQSVDPRSFEILRDIVDLEPDAALKRAAAGLEPDRDGSVGFLWADAARLSGTVPEAGEWRYRDAALRLMLAALFVELNETGRSDAWIDSSSLTRLGAEDVTALYRELRFPAESDPLRYLLRRGPGIRDTFADGEYVAVRMLADEDTAALIEFTSRPLLGLGPEPTITDLSGQVPAGDLEPGQRAVTRRVNLSVLSPLVLAAKAARVIPLASTVGRPYARLVMANALQQARSGDRENLAWPVYRAESDALREIRSAGSETAALVAWAEALTRREPASAFFARRFDIAERLYARQFDAMTDRGDRAGIAWAAWGVGASRLASGDVPAAVAWFDRMLGAGTGEGAVWAPVADAILRSLSPSEQAASQAGIDALTAKLTGFVAQEDAPEDRWRSERNVALVLDTIGRPDIGIRYLLSRQRADLSDAPASYRRWLLYELGAFLRDVFAMISFELGDTGSWVPRETPGYPVYTDFLRHQNDAGDLVGPGELLVGTATATYSMTEPEEDMATSVAVYGNPRDLVGPLSGPARALLPVSTAGPPAFADWAERSMSRTTPAPSLAPYLKLIWIEWFGVAFESLKDPGMTADAFAYAPLTASGRTDPADAERLLEQALGSPHQLALLKLMVDARSVLEDRY